MSKAEAVSLFGNASKLAKAIGISRSAVAQWRDPLPDSVQAKVITAALREGKPIPKHWLQREKSA